MTKILNSIALTGLSINKNHEEIIHSIVDILIREKREKKTKNKNSEYRSFPAETMSPATVNIYDN